MDDVRKTIYGTLVVFLIGVLGWIVYLYFSACGFSTSCQKGAAIVVVNRTPIPTLVPATLPANNEHGARPQTAAKCQVSAVDLIGAWVLAGYPETGVFHFKDATGTACVATFENDVQWLFTAADLWYPGALACAACHGPDLAASPARLDLSTYAGILAGSERTSRTDKGKDILGGSWEASLLYETLALGHPPEAPSESPIIFAGTPVAGPAQQAP